MTRVDGSPCDVLELVHRDVQLRLLLLDEVAQHFDALFGRHEGISGVRGRRR